MGHIRLGVLPKSRKWRQVIATLELDADVDAVAQAVSDAAETSLGKASSDPAFLHSFWLLTQLPLAARGPDFAQDARQLGLQLPNQASLMDITAALSAAVDRYASQVAGRTDLGEMAQMAAVESLVAIVGPALPSLFGTSSLDVQREIGRLSGGQQFARLAREFFTRLTQRVLHYYLSRELANHTGVGARFANDAARTEFDNALDLHCREASRIVQDFAGGWYGKTVYKGDGMTPKAVRDFAPVAFRKIRAELRKRQDAHG
jgi:hypothetical protein